MRKFNLFILTLLSVALMVAPAMVYAECADGPYALYVNGSKVATFVDAGESPDKLPQLNAAAAIKSGDKVEFCNTSCNELFFPQTIETGGEVDGSGNFTVSATYATCKKDGCYNFWWKKKYGEDKLYIGTDGNCGGSSGGGDDPVNPGQDFSTAVPSQCTDVMLQAFYWNSNSDGTYGTSKWTALKSQASEIAQYFQLVWLPPSCVAGDDMGYLPKQYHNQSSKMGNQSELQSLITALHNGGTRVIADVVINHASNKSSWIDFWEQDFGSYGKFQPQSTWITSDDEAKGKGTLSDHSDDGQEQNRNYGVARDWDHLKADVQNMCKAYLKYLKGSVGYDGYRFDYSVGYHVSHTNDYVSVAKPYISVMEYWVTNAGTLKTRIDQASKNTMTFDFAARDIAFQKGLAKNSYSNLVKSGLRGQGYQKYAVTFVDNHDTFKRPDNAADCGNQTDGSSINDKELIMQCNAYILSMPGIPCVFWPHWYKYKDDIKAMITARRSAGIHSESSVSETSGSGYYEATVTGKNGKVILYLGSSASKSAPSGYKQAVKGSKYAMYYTGTMPAEIEQAEIGKPMLDKAATMYNIMGQQVDAAYKGIVIQNGYKYLVQ